MEGEARRGVAREQVSSVTQSKYFSGAIKPPPFTGGGDASESNMERSASFSEGGRSTPSEKIFFRGGASPLPPP